MDENKTFHPEVLFVGGDGQAELAPKGVQVTAKVVGHVLGDKIRIGKYKKRTGYRRHNGFRAKLSQVADRGDRQGFAFREARKGRGGSHGKAEDRADEGGGGEAEACGEEAGREEARDDEGGEGVMAHKKGLGSSRNGRDSNPKMLGVKIFAGQEVRAGMIIVRQRGHPLPARRRARASAATTRSSPRRTGGSSSGRAASAAPSRSSES